MVDAGQGAGTGGGDGSPFFRAEGATKAEREAFQEYHHRTYGISFKSALIVVSLFVAILIGIYLFFT
jgi:hypothetical protein